MKKKLNTFFNMLGQLEFGDYILFQEYSDGKHDGVQYHYTVSKPIMAIYLGLFDADQTVGFNYVKWNNDNHTVVINNEHTPNWRTTKQVDHNVHSHIEWMDYIDILGHWKEKPKWKEIMKEYRKQNLKTSIASDEIQWNSDEAKTAVEV